MRVSITSTIAALFGLGVPVLAQTVNLRPGKYELTLEMELAGLPRVPPQKVEQCLTSEKLKDMSSLMGRPNEALGSEGCKMSDHKTSGNTVTFTTTCAGNTQSNEVTLSGDSYSGRSKGKMAGQDFAGKWSGKRIGDCAK
jgi:hypothetical protein